MALLNGLRRLFTVPKSPVVIETVGSPSDHAGNIDINSANQQATEPLNGPATSTTPPRPRVAPEPPRRPEEVAVIAQKISDHLEGQSRRSARMVEMLEKLPRLLDSLPEMNRQNTRLLEVLGEHQEQARKRDGNIGTTLSRITETAAHQSETLAMVHQQLDANRQIASRVAEALTSLRTNMAELNDTNRRLVESLDSLRTTERRRDTELIESVQKMQHWMIAAVACAAFSSIIALVVLLLTLL